MIQHFEHVQNVGWPIQHYLAIFKCWIRLAYLRNIASNIEAIVNNHMGRYVASEACQTSTTCCITCWMECWMECWFRLTGALHPSINIKKTKLYLGYMPDK